METKQEVLLKVLNNVMLNATNLIDQIINYNTEINDKDVSNAKQALKFLRGLDILEDMIMVALNDAFKQVDKETEKKMGKYANAMPGLF